MHLIAKNKIAEYIQLHPEAQTAFGIWFKQFPYRERKRVITNEQVLAGALSGGSANIGGGYQVNYMLSHVLNTAHITWLGTEQERAIYEDQRFLDRKAKNPDAQMAQKVKVVSVTVKPPPLEAILSGQVTSRSVAHSDDDEPVLVNDFADSDQDFKTEAEYEAALTRAISIFDARPGTPEFDELRELLPLIKNYEYKMIILPPLDPVAVINFEMKKRNMHTLYLKPMIGGDEEAIKQVLAGKKPLTDKMIEEIYHSFGIGFLLK